MAPDDREFFDQQLEWVLATLPRQVQQFLEEIPLVVDDAPSTHMVRELELESADDLCGLHTGIPLTERSVDQSGVHSSVVHLFREGILSAACDEAGLVTDEALRREIRVTILHEFGHHVGLSEEDLDELGYG